MALKMATDSLAHIHPVTSGYDFFSRHLVAIFSARILTKHSASQHRTLSTETNRGVKEAQRTSAASQYFLFSSSAVDKIAATSLCEYDGVSVSISFVPYCVLVNNVTMYGLSFSQCAALC